MDVLQGPVPLPSIGKYLKLFYYWHTNYIMLNITGRVDILEYLLAGGAISACQKTTSGTFVGLGYAATNPQIIGDTIRLHYINGLCLLLSLSVRGANYLTSFVSKLAYFVTSVPY